MERNVFSTLALPAIAAHAGGPIGFGFALFFIIPLFFLLIFAIFASIGRRRWMRSGGYGPWGHGNWSQGGWGSASRTAELTLAERFAQGDIDEKEYRARLEVLRASNPAPTPKS
jgi:putative membrane protein